MFRMVRVRLYWSITCRLMMKTIRQSKGFLYRTRDSTVWLILLHCCDLSCGILKYGLCDLGAGSGYRSDER